MRIVLKWLAALIVASVLFVFVLILLLSGMAAAFQPQPVQVQRASVLVLDLGFNLVDSPRSVDPLAQILGDLQGGKQPDVPLRQALAAVERAQADDRIIGILLQGNLTGGGLGNSIAALGELRSKLEAFQQSGKKLWAYVDNDGLGDYFLKSVAQEVWMNPYSMVDFKGMGTEILYWGETFDQIGVGVQVVKAGQYKTAAESFIDSTMSPENREQTTALLDSIWRHVRTKIGSSRQLSLEQLDQIASEKALLMSEESLRSGLVDALVPYDELVEALIAAGSFDPVNESFRQVSFIDFLELDRRARKTGTGGKEIAVVYVEGAIVDGEGEGALAGADRIVGLLSGVRQDDAVKAVVLRVNSPGGSAHAAEKILREVELTRSAKPVVVSMGGYAASGGYWVSSLADSIVAEPTTVTGSIGVFSMLPHIAGLLERLNLQVERVETNRLTTIGSIFREKTPEELARFQGLTDTTYRHFVERVSRGRNIDMNRIQELAEGRVWSGEQALNVGLVDRLGGIGEAIAHAADLAGLGNDFRVTDHPEARGFEEVLAELLSPNKSASLGEAASRILIKDSRFKPLDEEIRWLQAMNDPRHLYAYSPLRLRW